MKVNKVRAEGRRAAPHAATSVVMLRHGPHSAMPDHAVLQPLPKSLLSRPGGMQGLQRTRVRP